MLSLKITAPYEIQKDISEERTCPLPDNSVLIKIKRVSLCGSDIRLYKGQYNGPCCYPIIFGHEWSGEIIKVGNGVKDYSPGDRVTGDCSCFCGKCSNCKDDKNLCINIEKFGITKDGYAKDIALADEKYIYKAPSDISFDVLALCEVFAVAAHAIKRSGFKAGVNKKVMIIGCGAVGLAALLLLYKHYGCYDISVNERSEVKLHKLQDIFPEIFKDIKLVREEKKQIGGYRDIYDDSVFDYIFDASGTVKGLSYALCKACTGGTISYIGLDDEPLEMSKLITLKALKISGSVGGTGEFEEVLLFLQKHQNIVQRMVTFEVEADKAEEAFFQAIHNEENIKSQIIF